MSKSSRCRICRVFKAEFKAKVALSPLTATALVASVVDANADQNGLQMAWALLTKKQAYDSTIRTGGEVALI